MPRRKTKFEYPITREIKDTIINYCEEVILFVRQEYLSEQGILENEFLEYLFTACEKLYKATGNFKLNSQQIFELMEIKKENSRLVEIVESNEGVLSKIDKNDNLLFEFKNDILVLEMPENFNEQ